MTDSCAMPLPSPSLVDPFGRRINYLRLSVTDRCDFRCVYCMAETMTFLPRDQVLSIEELAQVGRAFIQLGVEKIRITGGEPLIRNNMLELVASLAQTPGLKELCLTTNGSRLEHMAAPLSAAGLQRINISLDSLQPERFRQLTRHGDLHQVLKGIEAAQQAGFARLKLNAVILQNHNLDEVVDLVDYALNEGLDISFIEEMPLGIITSHGRAAEFVSSATLRDIIGERYALTPNLHSSGGPARYWEIAGYPSRIGFISPHSDNFCGSCNRVRVSAEGKLLLCLGNEQSLDLRAILRNTPDELAPAIIKALQLKPEKHHFDLQEQVDIVRFMSATGG